MQQITIVHVVGAALCNLQKKEQKQTKPRLKKQNSYQKLRIKS